MTLAACAIWRSYPQPRDPAQRQRAHRRPAAAPGARARHRRRSHRRRRRRARGRRARRSPASASISTAAASCRASRTRTCTSSSGRSRSRGSISRATRSRDEVLAAAGSAAPGANGWLIGAGWRAAHWPAGDPEPHREALDAACGDRPVLLWAHDHHTAWLSSAALALLPIGTAPVVERDAAGAPTGVLRETAAWDAAAALPAPRESEIDAAVAQGPARGPRARRDGHPRLPARARPRRLAAPARRPPPARCACGPRSRPSGSTRSSRSGCAAASATSGCASARSRPSPTARSARAPPRCSSRSPTRVEARRCSSADELRDLGRASADAGLDVAVHAIGDAANRDGAGRARGDARALGPRRPAPAHRARAAARPRRPRAASPRSA